MKSVNPATGALIREYPAYSPEQVEQAIAAAHTDFLRWQGTDFTARGRHMRRAAEMLRGDAVRLAGLMTEEMGKPIREARAEIEKCVLVCEYYAEHAPRFLADEEVETGVLRSFIAYQPMGLILAVMPWNFPFWQVFRFAAPALMAGNGALLKHASSVSGCALAIEEIFRHAGFPEHLFRTLLIGSERVASVIEDRRVMAVTLTGSAAAGRAVAAKAGACLKKTVLELGGSDPYIVLQDADIPHAAEICARSRLLNGGQSCIAAKRFIIVPEVYEVFLTAFTAAMRARNLGDPADPVTDIGPQACFALRDALHNQVVESIARGAKCVLGGEIPAGTGAFYPPTILTEVAPGMPAYEEELFGPVASVIRARDEVDALRIANGSRFGLGGAVFTRDLEKGARLARESIESGCVAVNDFVKSDPRLPFGGIRESGYGRELSSFGILEFVNIKSVVIG